MNLKKTTKDKLYAMLCEEQKKRAEAEEIMRKQAENAHTMQEQIASLEKECETRVEALNDELIKANAEIAGLRREVEQDSTVIKGLRDEMDRCVGEIIQSEEHPWRHLWKCLWR